jgi:hypothetical protein
MTGEEDEGEKQIKATICWRLIDGYMALQESDKVAETWQRYAYLGSAITENVALVYDYYLDRGDLQRLADTLVSDRNPLRRGLYSGLIDDARGDLAAAEREWGKVARREIDEETQGIEYWMEAGLRLGEAQRVIDEVMPILAQGKTTMDAAVLFGMAWAMKGEVERADSFLQALRDDLTWTRGALFPRAERALLETLVKDEAVRAALSHHFEADEEAPEDAQPVEPVAAGTPETEAVEPEREG